MAEILNEFTIACVSVRVTPKGQRYTMVMAVVPQSFVDETLWPLFERFDDVLAKRVLNQQPIADVEAVPHVLGPQPVASRVQCGGYDHGVVEGKAVQLR